MTDEIVDRYDRQVRLWGEHGQRTIGQTSVAVIGSSALAAEILKSLILAGIESFKIFDDALVKECDTGNNFFLTHEDIGKSRAEVVAKYLNEMNPSVKGESARRSFTVGSSLAVFNDFSLVVGVHLHMDVASYIANQLYQSNVPFVWTTCVGLVGYFRLSFRDHEILHDHKEEAPHDFRLHKPFQALKDFADAFDLKNMEHEKHSHVPFLIIYLKALDFWRTRVGDQNALPTSYKQRKNFISVIMGMQKENEQGIYNEVNFEEAKQQVIKSFSGLEPNESLQRLFNDPRTNPDTVECEPLSSFWIYVTAIKRFYDKHGYIPLSGSLPDMTSDTASYTELVNRFREQALAEAKEVHKEVGELQKLPKFNHIEDLAFDQTVNYCKNASRLGVLNGSNLADEIKLGIKPVFEQIRQHLQSNAPPENGCIQENGDQASAQQLEVHPFVWLVLLRASELFFKEKNRHPGTNGVPCAIDAKDLRERVKTLLEQTKDSELIAEADRLIPDSAIYEICRYGNAELNFVASIVGGVISQEIIKLCTQQYVPVDNSFVFDGNTQQSASIRL